MQEQHAVMKQEKHAAVKQEWLFELCGQHNESGVLSHTNGGCLTHSKARTHTQGAHARVCVQTLGAAQPRRARACARP